MDTGRNLLRLEKPTIDWEKTILHIDYDSFFASVEQQANPFFRDKPLGVTGGPNINRSIITASSIQAKKLGIKTGTPVYKARKIYPKIILVPSDFIKYNYVFEESSKIYNKYSDDVQPFSIDESFLDVTKTVKLFKGAENIAQKIKRDVQEKFGEVLTCSIGIGPNKLLAKLVSDFNKPNGIFQVTSENIEQVLESVKLTDFCGIGYRISEHLNNMGIHNVRDLQNTDLHTLHKHFGNVGSKFLKNLSYGINYEKVDKEKFSAAPKSIGHEHTLGKAIKDPREHLYKLSEMVGRRLRKNKLMGRSLAVYFRDIDKNGYFQRITMQEYIESSWKIYKIAENLTDGLHIKHPIRFLGLTIFNLTPKAYTTLPLFSDWKRIEKITQTADRINNKYGEATVFPASILAVKSVKKEGSSFLSH